MDNNSKENLLVENLKIIYSFVQKNKKYIYLFDSTEDMIQELTMKAWQSLDLYDDKYALTTYIYNVLKNYCIGIARAKKNQNKPITNAEMIEKTIEQRCDDFGIHNNEIMLLEDREEQRELYERLMANAKPLVKEYYESEMTFEEFAKTRGVSKQYIGRIVKEHQKKLQKENKKCY